MGTFVLFAMFTGNIDWGLDNENLSKFGKVILIIVGIFCRILFFVTAVPLALVENLFILPTWGIYNLSHKKEMRKSYLQFLTFK